MRKSKHKSVVSQNIKEYASHSSIHGVSYIFDKTIPVFDRLLWLIIFVASVSLATIMIYNTFTDWQDNQVITTLKNMAKPVTGLTFPAVTVCGSGQHMQLAERVLYNNFLSWKENKANSENDKSEHSFTEYLKDTFQTENGTNILDILDTMIAPSSEASQATAVLQNQQACLKTEEKKRRKRSVPSGKKN